MSERTFLGELLLLAADGFGRGSGLHVLSHFALAFRAGSWPLAR
jgi:hypothetical protein